MEVAVVTEATVVTVAMGVTEVTATPTEVDCDASTAAVAAVSVGGRTPMEVAEVAEMETLRLPPSLLSVSVGRTLMEVAVVMEAAMVREVVELTEATVPSVPVNSH